MAEQWNLAELQRAIAESGDILVVECYTDWCPSCRSFSRVFDTAAQAYTEQMQEKTVRFGMLNIESAQAFAQEYGVRSVPTVLIFAHGNVVAKQAGAVGTAPFIKWIKNNLEKIDNS